MFTIINGGRARWKVENETFNTLKNQGYSLGACPRIRILVKIEKFSQNKHSHIHDIASIIF